MDQLIQALQQSPLSHVPIRTISASNNNQRYQLVTLINQCSVGRPITIVGPDPLVAKHRKKLTHQHFLSHEVVILVFPETDLETARTTSYWTPSGSPDNRVLTWQASSPEIDAETVEQLYRMPTRIRSKLRRVPTRYIEALEKELPTLRQAAIASFLGQLQTA